jgi:hypothetical protein
VRGSPWLVRRYSAVKSGIAIVGSGKGNSALINTVTISSAKVPEGRPSRIDRTDHRIPLTAGFDTYDKVDLRLRQSSPCVSLSLLQEVNSRKAKLIEVPQCSAKQDLSYLCVGCCGR